MSLLKSVLAIATALSMNTAFAAGAAVPHTDAAKHYGHKITIEGAVVATSCDGKKCYVNFNEDFRKAVSAIIDTADIAKFTKATDPKAQQADLDKAYKGQKVHLTGVVTEYKSKDTSKPSRPQMSLTGPADIKVVK